VPGCPEDIETYGFHDHRKADGFYSNKENLVLRARSEIIGFAI
jgi:hypothetical protein